MTSPSNSDVQNLLPVQAYFNLDGSFNTFIGQGNPFFATANPNQSGLNITNSTINSTTIGATVPSTGVFTNIATTTGTITTAASSPTDIVNKQYVDFYAAGLSWKAPALTATSANITLSGLQTINGVTVVAGDTVLVKNQTNAAQNGIYVASSGAWTYSVGGDTWNEYISAIIFITSGSLSGTAWFCTAQPGGTLGVTAMNWSNFSVASSYTAGTGLTLIGTQFNITNTAVTPAAYGSATQVGTFTVNQQGQLTLAGNTTITPAVGSITGLGTGVATALAAGVTGSGNIVLATSPSLVTPILGTPTSGNFSSGTFTWPTFNQNTTGTAAGLSATLAITSGGTGQTSASSAFNALSPITTTGDLIIGNGTNSATRLAIGGNNTVLTSDGTTASWQTSSGGVSSFSAGTTGFTPNSATTGAITLAGTLAISNGGTGATTVAEAFSDLTPLTLTTASATPLVLTNTSSYQQQITGGTTQTITLPSTATLAVGWSFLITNATGFTVTVNTSTGANVYANANIGSYRVWCVSTANNNAASWSSGAETFSFETGTGNVVRATSPTIASGTFTSPTATGALAFTGTTNQTAQFATNQTTGNTTITTSQTSGTLTIGGASGTGTQTIGQSTVSQTTNIQAGATASGSTKTMNIGTGGLTGSTTAIAIGSTFGTTITLNGTVNGTISNATNVGIVDDTTTNATVYPVWSNGTTGNQALETSSTKLSFNPSTGTLAATVFSGAGTSLTGTASSLTAGAVSNALTAGTGLTATATYNGSAAITFNATGTTINSQTSGYTLVAADAGKTISITTGGVTIPNAVMAAGNIVSIYNNSGSSQTITQGSSLTLQWSGQTSSTTGNRTLALYGLCTIVFISSSNAVITGSGLT